MGENLVSKIANIPLKFIRSYGVPIAFAIGAGTACMGINVLAGGKMPDFDELGEGLINSVLNPSTWRNIAVSGGLFVGSLYGALVLRNNKRKKEGKNPVKLWEFTKQVLLPWTAKEGEQNLEEIVDIFPDSSLAHENLGAHYFREGKIIEAMEEYYRAVKKRDAELFPKVPIIGTNAYVNTVRDGIEPLEKRIESEGESNETLLELSMRHFLLNDFDNAIAYFEKVDRSQDPIALGVLASRLYSEIAERAVNPKVRRFSFGDNVVGRHIDNVIYFGRGHNASKSSLIEKANQETSIVVEKILALPDIGKYLKQIGEYDVYRVKINSFVDGFVVLKTGSLERLQSERRNEKKFQELVTGGRFKGVHPDGIVEHDGKQYLVLLYEEGVNLSECSALCHYRNTLEFAAKSDALMPLECVNNQNYEPLAHFKKRVVSAKLPSSVRDRLIENCGFMFKYSSVFPVVFDGDWHPDNCLVRGENIIALDKEDKGVTVGPVTAARVLNQGARFGSDEENRNNTLKDSMIESIYLPTYQKFAEPSRKINEPELFIPSMWSATMEKAVTGFCFARNLPARHKIVRNFLDKALHAGGRIMDDKYGRGFYDETDRNQCIEVQQIIYENLIPIITS